MTIIRDGVRRVWLIELERKVEAREMNDESKVEKDKMERRENVYIRVTSTRNRERAWSSGLFVCKYSVLRIWHWIGACEGRYERLFPYQTRRPIANHWTSIGRRTCTPIYSV